jgi:hypothetical protein
VGRPAKRASVSAGWVVSVVMSSLALASYLKSYMIIGRRASDLSIPVQPHPDEAVVAN